jgi:hypothetical protein
MLAPHFAGSTKRASFNYLHKHTLISRITAPVPHVVHWTLALASSTKGPAGTRHRGAVGGPRGTCVPRRAHSRTAAVDKPSR